ncbi:hypothetical protein [Desulfosporosinus sp. FKA]|uniref:hypothetical protein n=1 Tax=Desulfosporosinus sp. FKA TaxID=1969834 RepID=UPI000B49C3EE|nr:hypothetical protein [Desulfosporosinus sp. FKA]
MTPYEDHATQFLTTLYGHFQDDQFLYLWTLPDRMTWCFSKSDLKTMMAAARALQDERDVYFGVGASKKEIPQNKRPKAKEISAIPGAWIEIDLAALGAHAKQNLPKTLEEALSIIPNDLRPTLIVLSGNGLHLYWLFKQPWYLLTPKENRRAALLLLRLQAFIKQLADVQGWHIDSTADLNRLLRVPGTLNHKRGQKKPVYIHTFNPDIRYDPEDLESLIPEIDLKHNLQSQHTFTRLPTDASADLMIANCKFLQYCSEEAPNISYGEWMAGLTNVVRGVDGLEKCHELSSLDGERYSPDETVQTRRSSQIKSSHLRLC